MAKLRNATSRELETRVAGLRFVTKPDDVLEVPDEVYLDHEWPEAQWSEVECPPRRDPDSDEALVAGGVEAVKERVGDDPALAARALDAENAKKRPRESLVRHLEQIAEATDDTNEEN